MPKREMPTPTVSSSPKSADDLYAQVASAMITGSFSRPLISSSSNKYLMRAVSIYDRYTALLTCPSASRSRNATSISTLYGKDCEVSDMLPLHRELGIRD